MCACMCVCGGIFGQFTKRTQYAAICFHIDMPSSNIDVESALSEQNGSILALEIIARRCFVRQHIYNDKKQCNKQKDCSVFIYRMNGDKNARAYNKTVIGFVLRYMY